MSTTLQDRASTQPGPMGWGIGEQSIKERYEAEHVALEKMAEAMPACTFEQRARDVVDSPILEKTNELMMADDVEDGFSFHYLEAAIWGALIVWIAQSIGSCVASGGMRGIFARTIAQIFLFGEAAEFFGTVKPDQNSAKSLASFAPYSYGVGRQIGGIDSGGDGSFCGAHIQGLMGGILPCWASGLDQFCKQFPEPIANEGNYRQWGDRQFRDVRSQFKPVAEEFRLKESTKVTSASKGLEFLTQHYKPMMICSSWGFAPAQQISGSKFFIYKRSGSWAHNMTIYGALKIKGNWYIVVKNSWGMTAHKNGDYFLVPIEVFDSWLREAECQTIGDLTLPESRPMV